MASVTAIDYPALFRTYTQGMATWLLATTEAAGPALSSELRTEAMQVLDYAVDLESAWPQVSQLLIKLAARMEQAGLRAEWLPFLQRGIVESQRYGDQRSEAHLLLQIGQLCQLRGHFEQAALQLQASVSLFAMLHDWRNQAVALNRQAYVAILCSQLAEATALTNQAQHLLPENDPEVAYCHFMLGMVAKSNEDWRQAEAHFQQALTLRRQDGDLRQIALALLNLGTALRPQERYADAKHCYAEAISLFKALNDVFYLAITEMNLGVVYYCCNELPQSLEHYLRAEEVLRSLDDSARLAMIYNNIGLCYAGLGQWRAANQALLNSASRYRQMRSPVYLIETLTDLARTYYQLHDSSNAASALAEARTELANVAAPKVSARLQALIDNC